MLDVHRELFPVSASTYWHRLCLSLDYQEKLYRTCLGCNFMEVVENSGSVETGVQRNIRFEKPLDAPAPLRKLFGSTVTFEEVGRFDAQTETYAFSMKPPIMADQLRIVGQIRVAPNPGGCEVVTETSFECSVFGLGRLIEHFSAKSARESQIDKAAFTRDYIRINGLA